MQEHKGPIKKKPQAQTADVTQEPKQLDPEEQLQPSASVLTPDYCTGTASLSF